MEPEGYGGNLNTFYSLFACYRLFACYSLFACHRVSSPAGYGVSCNVFAEGLIAIRKRTDYILFLYTHFLFTAP